MKKKERNNEKDDDEKEEDNDEQDKKTRKKTRMTKKQEDPQEASKKRKWIYKKKIDFKQGKKDYKRWMNQLKTIKSNGGKQVINAMDKHLSKMIQEYKIQLSQQGYEYDAGVPFSDQDVVNVVDSNEDKDYVDLETIGVWLLNMYYAF